MRVSVTMYGEEGLCLLCLHLSSTGEIEWCHRPPVPPPGAAAAAAFAGVSRNKVVTWAGSTS
jgi:hypothetical protein